MADASTQTNVAYGMLLIDAGTNAVQSGLNIANVNDQMAINEQLFKRELANIRSNAELQIFLLETKQIVMANDFLASAAASGVQGESVAAIAESFGLQSDKNIANVNRQAQEQIDIKKIQQEELRKKARAQKQKDEFAIVGDAIKFGVTAAILL